MADTADFIFSGTLDIVGDGISSEFSVGDPFTLSVSYDTQAPHSVFSDAASGGTFTNYDGLASIGFASLDYGFSYSGGIIRIENDVFAFDKCIAQNNSDFTPPAIGDFTDGNIFVTLLDLGGLCLMTRPCRIP